MTARGFAALAPERMREIAKLGGPASQVAKGTHRWTPEEAAAAGRKGGRSVSADREHMARIGQAGGKKRVELLRAQQAEEAAMTTTPASATDALRSLEIRPSQTVHEPLGEYAKAQREAMRALPEDHRVLIVELLLSGYTPQEIAGSELVTSSLPSVQRIARAAGLARSVGAPEGRKHESHKRWSRHRDRVRQLRAEGYSLRTIAALVGLRSPTQVSNLLDEEEEKELHCVKITGQQERSAIPLGTSRGCE